MTMQETVEAYLGKRGWAYRAAEDGPLLFVNVPTESGRLRCRAVIADEHGVFGFSSRLWRNVPADRRVAIAELIARINLHVTHGHFNLDFDRGIVYCQASVRLGDEPLPPQMVHVLAQVTIDMMAYFGPALEQVIDGTLTPAEAMPRRPARRTEAAH